MGDKKVSKSMAKARKKWYEDDYDDFDRVFVNKPKKTENVEVKKSKKNTVSKMKHMSRDELMDIYSKEEDFY